MQEIEFRGKFIHTNEWVNGYLVKQFGEFKIYDDNKEDFKLWIFKVIPETIGQYIGIKDIHQKKVFQGDIVKVKEMVYTDCYRDEIEEVREYVGEIVWHQNGWNIAEMAEEKLDGENYKFTRFHTLWFWNLKDDESDPDNCFMEIIGNRWDNPEMKVT